MVHSLSSFFLNVYALSPRLCVYYCAVPLVINVLLSDPRRTFSIHLLPALLPRSLFHFFLFTYRPLQYETHVCQRFVIENNGINLSALLRLLVSCSGKQKAAPRLLLPSKPSFMQQ
jgi:hypothetical protein